MGLRLIKQVADSLVDTLVAVFVKTVRFQNVHHCGEGIFFEHERAEHGGFHFEALGRQLAGGRHGHGLARAAAALEGSKRRGPRIA